MKKANNKGFTLAELLIVVAIIAVLVAVAIPTFSNQLEKSRQAVDISNLRGAYAAARIVEMNGDVDGVKFSDQEKAGYALIPTPKPTGVPAYGPRVIATNACTQAATRITATPTPSAIHILQYWYNPNDGTLHHANEPKTGVSDTIASVYAMADNSASYGAKEWTGRATSWKLLADTDNLPNADVVGSATDDKNSYRIMEYAGAADGVAKNNAATLDLALGLSPMGSGTAGSVPTGIVGTTEKAILVVFQKDAGGKYILSQIAFRAASYSGTPAFTTTTP